MIPTAQSTTMWRPRAPATSNIRAIWGTGPADVYAAGEDGILLHWNGARWSALQSGTDLALHPDFERNRVIYISYTKPLAAPQGPAPVGRGGDPGRSRACRRA